MECIDCLFLFDDYIDGELEETAISDISEHLEKCQSCAAAYQEFSRQQEAFEQYLLQAEATPALWRNLQTAIRNENTVQATAARTTTTGRKFKSVFGNFGLIFSPHAALALGSLCLVFYCAFVFLFVSDQNSRSEYAHGNSTNSPVSLPNEPMSSRSQISGHDKGDEISEISQNKEILPNPEKRPKVLLSNQSIKRINLSRGKTIEQIKTRTKRLAVESNDDYLPGEREYLETISKLNEQVESIEADLPKEVNAQYKRNLLAIDQAITKTRESAKRYPKNEDVKNFVSLAYQGKIALLSAIARK